MGEQNRTCGVVPFCAWIVLWPSTSTAPPLRGVMLPRWAGATQLWPNISAPSAAGGVKLLISHHFKWSAWPLSRSSPLEALVKPPAFCGLLSTACCCLRPAGEAEGIRLQAAATSEALHHISEALRVNPLSPQVRLPSHDFFPLYGPQTVVVVSPFLPRLHLLCNGKVMQVTTL